MAQKSITSFFTIQKKKIDENPRENDSETKELTTEKKCEKTEKSPVANGKKTALVEVTSPVVCAAGKRKASSRRIVVSSDEEENASPSEETRRSTSPEATSGDTTRKSVRRKIKKGADSLKEIEEKRAAKRARLASQDSAEPEQEKTENAKVLPDTESEPMDTETVQNEVETVKSEEDIAAQSPEQTESPDSEKEESVSPAKVEVSESTSNVSDTEDHKEELSTSAAEVASDLSDAEEQDKGKDDKKFPKLSTKPATKAKVTKKKSPASSKKPKTTVNKAAIASFFAPKVKKTDEPKDTSKTSPSKATPSSGKTFFSSPTKSGTDTNVGDYNPAKTKYHPIDDATWQHGKPVPYLALARTLECIEETSARLRIAEILSNFLRSVIVLSPDNLLQCIYLCLNKIAPAFEGLELGLAERSLMKAVAQSSGRSEKQVLQDTEDTGDLGIVAQNSCGRQAKLFQPPPLTVPGVFNQLKTVATMKGRDSMSKKLDKVVAMYNACKPIEARYLIRSLLGKLRIGLAEQTVLQALALACTTTPPGQEFPPAIINASQGMAADAFKAKLDQQALILKSTYCECPVYDKIIPMLLEHGIEELPNRCQISPGIPLRPMLAHPTKGVAEVLAKFDGRRFTCEWKYDGERAQIHISGRGASVRIFSRNQEDNTSKYPELVNRLGSQLSEDISECILDCEAVGWDREANRILPFQILSTRKKKDANEADIKVQVCLFVFDLLYVNGEPLVKVPLEERRRRLKEVVKEVPGQLQLANSLDTDSLEEVQAYLEDSIKGNCEGLMVKTLEQEATYEIAKRSHNWLKLKKDYLEGVGDTLDLVVLGGYLGRGKRAGVYGGFLLGCYDPETEEYQSICKIGTGFSDESLQTHSDFFKQHVLPSGPRPYYRFDPNLAPDHWFDAVQVWEVKCADLSLSPVHKAAIGIVDNEKGISLRFPRFLRIRDDKKVEEATSASQVADLYRNQDQVKNQAADSKTTAEDDFY